MSNLDNNRTYCVYIHTSPSNKAYIGITCQSTKERWGRNGVRYKYNNHFWNAIQKYGWDNFKHEVLFENLTKEKACEIEILLIALFDTQNPKFGYNKSSGGDRGFLGCHLSDEARKKISESNKGLLVGEKNPMYGISPKERMDEETYNLWRNKLKVCMSSKEFKEKMRKINIGKKYSDEINSKKGRKGKSHPMYGKHHSEETKKKMSEAQKGKKYSHEINLKKGLKGAKNPSARVVDQYSKDGVFIKRWEYAKLAEDALGIKSSNIIACCRGIRGRKTAGGFVWKYACVEVEGLLCVS